jgi:hypothetical protein
MDVIGHEDISVDAAAIALCSFREPPSVLDVVVFAEEDRAAIVAALDDVERLIGQEGATESGHGAALSETARASLPNVPAWRKKSYSDPDF